MVGGAGEPAKVRDRDVCSCLECWESCSQREGELTLRWESARWPWWHRADSSGFPLSLSALEKEQMGFLLALGSAGVAGEEGALPASKKGGCEASPRGILEG